MSLAAQRWLDFGSEAHGHILHSRGSGFVTIANRHREKWIESHIPAKDVADFLKEYQVRDDAYISQNRFSAKRRLVSLLHEANALFVDLDFYQEPELRDAAPEYVAELALELLVRARIPEPSLIISSGRGLVFVWLHTPLGPADRPRWDDAQTRIFRVLSSLKADPAVRHAASVLRLVGTINSKSGRTVEVIGGTFETWDWKELFDELQPAAVADIFTEAGKRGKAGIFAPRLWQNNARTLWALRMSEILALVRYRWPEGVPQGWRDKVLFLLSVSFSWTMSGKHVARELPREVSGLASRLITSRHRWTTSDTKSTLAASLKRALRAARGELIEWRGLKVDPRYRFKRDTLIDLLQVEPEEMRTLDFRSLVTDSIHRERDALRKRESRAVGPIQTDTCLTRGSIQSHTCVTDYKPRDRYEAESKEALRPWEALGISRATYYRRQAAEAYAALGEDVTARVSADVVGL